MRDFPGLMMTKRTILRKISVKDALGWKAFNNAIAKITTWPLVPSITYARNELLHYEQMWALGHRYTYIILERSSGKVIGDFHIKRPDWKRKRVEYGHALHPRVWGTGITYETLDAAKKAAQKLGLHLWAKVEEENIRSWKSLEKYGAAFMGTKTYSINSKKLRMRTYELR
jgi:RimJ/RimL family protein N-acetyltransferase